MLHFIARLRELAVAHWSKSATLFSFAIEGVMLATRIPSPARRRQHGNRFSTGAALA
jgi:hypothetical protein